MAVAVDPSWSPPTSSSSFLSTWPRLHFRSRPYQPHARSVIRSSLCPQLWQKHTAFCFSLIAAKAHKCSRVPLFFQYMSLVPTKSALVVVPIYVPRTYQVAYRGLEVSAAQLCRRRYGSAAAHRNCRNCGLKLSSSCKLTRPSTPPIFAAIFAPCTMALMAMCAT